MREILFRGFHPCDGPETILVDGEKVKGRWVEGYYVERDNKSWIYPASNQMISKSLARELRPFHSAKSTQKIMKEVFPVLPSTVGQYTGLTDKNGKRIFEGDIVRRETDYYGKHNIYDEPVVWENDIENDSFGEPYTSGYCIHGGNWEVIGTVFDEEVSR